MFSNWTTKKTIWTLAIIAIIVAIYNWKAIAGRLGFGERGKKTDCVGGFITYAGVQSNIPCSALRPQAGDRAKRTECIGGYVTYAGVASNIPCSAL